jgi:hypothetical protein
LSLKEKIIEWAPAFASYLIHIYCSVYKKLNGPIVEPIEVKDSTNQYKNENNYIEEFIDCKIIKTDDNTKFISYDEIWQNFCDWYINSYKIHKLPMKKNDFSKIVKEGKTKLGTINNKDMFMGFMFKLNTPDNNGDLDS